jgi:hypothetical protein
MSGLFSILQAHGTRARLASCVPRFNQRILNAKKEAATVGAVTA